MRYDDYIAAFNTGDDAALVRDFYTPDCVFQTGSRRMVGHAELLEFLRWAHDGVREVIRAKLVLEREDAFVAEIDMDFHASRDRPDFVFKPLKAGETVTVKFFAVYRLRDGKVCELKTANWPAEVGVTKREPRLGGSPEQRQAYFDYCRAFSDADFDGFSAYYADDVVFELPGGAPPIHGLAGIVAFYREVFKTVRERLIVHALVADDTGIAANIESEFIAIEDAPDFMIRPLKKGQTLRGEYFIFYALKDGKITGIRVARKTEPVISG